MASRMEWWNGGIVPVKAGNRDAGGFVNSAVMHNQIKFLPVEIKRLTIAYSNAQAFVALKFDIHSV